jgi:3-hydroxyisobutyrate dehydrogenase/2-hydroxy-3-oxopropionate reductase
VLAEAAGIDRALAHEVIATGAAGAPYVAYKKAAFLEPESTPVAFSLDLTAKDMHLIATLARSVDVSMPQAEVNATVVREASTGGRGSNDFSTVASELRSRRHARAAAGG